MAIEGFTPGSDVPQETFSYKLFSKLNSWSIWIIVIVVIIVLFVILRKLFK